MTSFSAIRLGLEPPRSCLAVFTFAIRLSSTGLDKSTGCTPLLPVDTPDCILGSLARPRNFIAAAPIPANAPAPRAIPPAVCNVDGALS